MKSSIAVDNGRSTEFIRRRDYPDKSQCYECGQEGHLSYCCTNNTLGSRKPPPKRVRIRKKSAKQEKCDTSYLDTDSDEGMKRPRCSTSYADDVDDNTEEEPETLSAVIAFEVCRIFYMNVIFLNFKNKIKILEKNEKQKTKCILY